MVSINAEVVKNNEWNLRQIEAEGAIQDWANDWLKMEQSTKSQGIVPTPIDGKLQEAVEAARTSAENAKRPGVAEADEKVRQYYSSKKQ